MLKPDFGTTCLRKRKSIDRAMGLSHGQDHGNGNEKPCYYHYTQGEQVPWVGHRKASITAAMACGCSFVYILSLFFLTAHPCWTSSSCPPPPCVSPFIFPAEGASIRSFVAAEKAARTRDRREAAELSTSLVDRGLGASRRNTDLSRIVFGIAAATDMWWGRKEYLKLWWRPSRMRGYVFLDKPPYGNFWPPEWPPYRISQNTSHFQYTYKGGWRSAIRISRLVSELLRLDLPNVDWFVMGDDDTLFFADNLVHVLSKYDPTLMYYIGGNSESHLQNILFSYTMAFGGGGFAISYPLAQALAAIQDDCLSRYPYLFGSDDRMHACMAELGIPVTKEPGFHQLDVVEDISGLLAAHPVAPLVTLHHLEIIKPIFPSTAAMNYTRVRALQHLLKAAEVEAGSVAQQSICYAPNLQWSFSVSWGYVVLVHKGFVSPREFQVPQRSFRSWYKQSSKVEFPFNTREIPEDVCKQATKFFMDSISDLRGLMTSIFLREINEENRGCAEKLQPLSAVKRIRVMRKKLDHSWYQVPRRSCCRVRNWRSENIDVDVGPCEEGESLIGSY